MPLSFPNESSKELGTIPCFAGGSNSKTVRQEEIHVLIWVGKIPRGKAWQPIPSVLAGELALTKESVAIVCGVAESDMAGVTNTHRAPPTRALQAEKQPGVGGGGYLQSQQFSQPLQTLSQLTRLAPTD